MLAILTTHPIQYQVPIWRGLAARGTVPFTVFYMSDQGLRHRFDPGFGRTLAWDIDLLSGYPYEFLDVQRGDAQDSFRWLRLKKGFSRMLRDRGVRALWVQGWQVAAYWQAVWSARRAGMKVWLRGETNLRSGAGGPAQGLKRGVLRQMLARVDRFLCIGEANRQFYLSMGIPTDRMAFAPYGVENSRFAVQADKWRPKRSALRDEWRIPPDAFCVLFVGKFILKKRPLDVIEAVRRFGNRCPDRRIHILWVGTGELEGALRAACTVHYSDGRVCVPSGGDSSKPAASFAGFLNQTEISRAYVAADALILPSDGRETWGLVVNEAMASGLPCAVSAACGCAEDLVLPLRPDLCFPVGDVEAMANALISLRDNPPSAEKLRAHIEKYDPARTVECAERLYAAVGAHPHDGG